MRLTESGKGLNGIILPLMANDLSNRIRRERALRRRAVMAFVLVLAFAAFVLLLLISERGWSAIR